MSNGIFNLHHLGRFGNVLFGYCFARGYCEHFGFELHTDPWVGERIFCIDHPRCRGDLERRDENTLIRGEGNISYRSYSQRQKCADFYTLAKVKEWLRFRPHVEAALQGIVPRHTAILAHLRRGDYAGYGYPLLSRDSYIAACGEHNLGDAPIEWVSEEQPATHPDFTGELACVPDFFRMAKAKTLLRANSSFSFWAGALVEANGGTVMSPVIDRLKGGVEHDCKFVRGNHARIADLDFVEPIHICQQ